MSATDDDDQQLYDDRGVPLAAIAVHKHFGGSGATATNQPAVVHMPATAYAGVAVPSPRAAAAPATPVVAAAAPTSYAPQLGVAVPEQALSPRSAAAFQLPPPTPMARILLSMPEAQPHPQAAAQQTHAPSGQPVLPAGQMAAVAPPTTAAPPLKRYGSGAAPPPPSPRSVRSPMDDVVTELAKVERLELMLYHTAHGCSEYLKFFAALVMGALAIANGVVYKDVHDNEQGKEACKPWLDYAYVFGITSGVLCVVQFICILVTEWVTQPVRERIDTKRMVGTGTVIVRLAHETKETAYWRLIISGWFHLLLWVGVLGLAGYTALTISWLNDQSTGWAYGPCFDADAAAGSHAGLKALGIANAVLVYTVYALAGFYAAETSALAFGFSRIVAVLMDPKSYPALVEATRSWMEAHGVAFVPMNADFVSIFMCQNTARTSQALYFLFWPLWIAHVLVWPAVTSTDGCMFRVQQFTAYQLGTLTLALLLLQFCVTISTTAFNWRFSTRPRSWLWGIGVFVAVIGALIMTGYSVYMAAFYWDGCDSAADTKYSHAAVPHNLARADIIWSFAWFVFTVWYILHTIHDVFDPPEEGFHF